MITIKIATRRHRVCQKKCPDDLWLAEDKWQEWGLDKCDGAAIAMDGNVIVGFFRFNVLKGSSVIEGPYMYAAGTWVERAYRKDGLGLKMWKKALRHVKPEQVYVYITSPNGRRLIRSVQENTTSRIRINVVFRGRMAHR